MKKDKIKPPSFSEFVQSEEVNVSHASNASLILKTGIEKKIIDGAVKEYIQFLKKIKKI